MLVKYRHYKLREMIELLTKERVYYSRGHSVFRGRHIPDAVFLAAAADDADAGAINIGCEINNNTDGVRDIVEKTDFSYDEENGRFLKLWTIPFENSTNSIQLLEIVMAGLEMARECSPFLLYASSWQKMLADYYRFMTSPLPKVSYGALMHELGYGDDLLQATDDKEAGEETDYLIAPYKKRWWAAWVSGDHIVPLFASQAEASRFLRERAACSSLNKVVIGSISAKNRNRMPNPYVLVDHGRSATEKIAWLQTEIDRLRRQSAIRLPEASNNYK